MDSSTSINACTLFQDTHVPDIFIKEYLPILDGECVKVYIYSLFLSEKGGCDQDILKRIFGYDDIQLKNYLNKLSNLGLITTKSNEIVILDIKERELNKYFRPRTSLDVNDKLDKKSASIRNGMIKHISDTFFAGQMAPSWYGEIDLWFEKYDFDDDVMYMLFQHCSDQLNKSNQSLNKAYVGTVAKNWFDLGIKTCDDLEKYLAEYEKYKGVKAQVIKKLRIIGNLTEYEEKVIKKWFFEYKYTFDVIELALKKSVTRRNATLATYDRYLTEWFNNGLRTAKQILDYEANKRKKSYYNTKNAGQGNAKPVEVPQSKYKDQRKYDEEFFKSLEEKIE